MEFVLEKEFKRLAQEIGQGEKAETGKMSSPSRLDEFLAGEQAS